MRTLILLLLLLSLNSCYKAEHITTDTPLTYAINGWGTGMAYAQDTGWSVTLAKRDTGILRLNVIRQSGDPRNINVNCKILNLPTGVTSSFDSISSGLDFTTSLTLAASTGIDTGIYPSNISLQVGRDIIQNYPIRIHILP